MAMKYPEKQRLSRFFRNWGGVHICNTWQKKDCDKDSQDKFKLPFGP